MVIVLAVLCFTYFSCKKDNPPKENIMGNNPPVAKAGPDQTIILPEDSVYLDGSASYDPSGKIVSWLWTCTSAPFIYTISDSTIARPEIKNLTAGYYQFVLKVTDMKGLFSTDTVLVNVIGRPTTYSSVSVFVFPNAEQVGIFSDSLNPFDLASVVCNNKFYYCDGYHMDVFDPSSNLLTANGHLSESRTNPAAVSAEDNVFFAGGIIGIKTASKRVDIYNTTTNSWSKAELSSPRYGIKACSIGSKVFFAGGWIDGDNHSNRIDIYDIETNSWTYKDFGDNPYFGTRADFLTDFLPVVLDNKVWFVRCGTNEAAIYDAITNSWSSKTFSTAVNGNNAIILNNKIYFTGNKTVQVYDIPTNSWSSIVLNENKILIPAAVSNNKIAFIGGMTSWFVYSTTIEIYDPATNSWSIQYMSDDLYYEAIISYNNYIYSAGGVINQENTTLSSICRFQL
jgi:hypothetical protein